MKATDGSGLWTIFAASVMVVVFAELGCLARTSALAARYGQPWVIFAGTMVGTAITMGVGILFGQVVREYLSETMVRWLTGSFFLAFGVLVLAGRLQG